MEQKQKWEYVNGVFYPIPGSATLHNTPGMGVFQVYESKSLGGTRIGLYKVADKFTFDFKIYHLGTEDIMSKVETTWNSKVFVEGNKNLGVIFNGLKGTGKTIASKILANRMNLPVIVISNPSDSLLEFIQGLCFECVVLIDEAEKTFRDKSDVLLRMIDGVYNESRKLYILTTNRLSIDENLLGRPGRIRYIKQFGNLTIKAVNDYVYDNLEDKSKIEDVLNAVDQLEISTIDILKSIVDEVNIHGSNPENSMLNVPKASFRIDIVRMYDLAKDQIEQVKNFVKKELAPGEDVYSWGRKFWKMDDDKRLNNFNRLEEEFSLDWYKCQISSKSSFVYKGMSTRYGEVVEEPDELGFFVVHDSYDDEDELCVIVNYRDAPSLYRGGLKMSNLTCL